MIEEAVVGLLPNYENDWDIIERESKFFFQVLVLLKIVVGQCTQNLKFKKLIDIELI